MKIEEKVWPARSWYAKEIVAKLWYMDAVDEPEEKIGARFIPKVLLKSLLVSKNSYRRGRWMCRGIEGDGDQ